ncbi:hypothetical protein [Pseudovibrio sp. SPO723]|uniref:hypothetical protein n=1 Tax=Nesiotobacter zosterae TaxID=392721 RepID=UPI0029C32486|nr:hypothetical protein [Pseudovibrio sp. SPO723]MDX5592654.1 hypothetical protein [Pseudovibrio sp. SPO723]
MVDSSVGRAPEDYFSLKWGFATILFLCVVLGTSALAAYTSPQTWWGALEENGPVELLSVVLWLCVSLAVLSRCKLDTIGTSVMVTFVAFAAREADLHKAFSSDSFFKLRFYTSGEFGLEQVLFGIVAVVLMAVIAISVFALFRFIFLRGGWRTAFGQVMVVGAGLLLATKAADRLPSILRVDYDLQIGPEIAAALRAFEETGELMVSFLFLVAFAWFNKTARFNGRPLRSGQ